MARKRAAADSIDEPEDPLVAWERFMSRRRAIDADASDLISEYQGRIAKMSPEDGLSVATRAARRVRKAPMPDIEIAEVTRNIADQAVCLTGVVLDRTPEERGRLEPLVDVLSERLYATEERLYKLDREAHHYAILENARVAARLLECIRQVIRGEKEEFARRAASTIAHSIEGAELSRGGDERDRVEGAIRSDLKIIPKSEQPLPLWPSSPPAWYLEKDESRELSKIREYVIKGLMAKQQSRKQAQDDILKGATLPPHGQTPSKEATPSENLAIAERRFAEVQQIQFAGIQKLLDTLRGATFKTHEDAREVALRVRRLVQKSGGVLLLSGEFVDGRKRTKIFTNQPVEVRCDDRTSSSFQMKTPDKFKYVTSLPNWPAVFIVSKDAIANPQPTDGDS